MACGGALEEGTRLKLVKASVMVTKENVAETVPTVKAFVWFNGVESCFVGYVSKAFQCIYQDLLDGRVVDVRKFSYAP
jgi:hypothetical protein